MKLRLPKTMQAALMVALANYPVVTYADYVWNGGDTITTESWGTESSWEMTNGSEWKSNGPGVPNSAMWDTIVINGASGSVAQLEGWYLKLNLGVLETDGNKSAGNASTLTVGNIKKFQTANDSNDICEINIGQGSTLNISRGVENISGNSNNSLHINFIEGGTINFTSGIYGGSRDNTGSAPHNITVNYGNISDGDLSAVGSFNFSYTPGTDLISPYTLGDLTLTATISDSISSDETTLHKIELGSISAEAADSLVYDITADNFIRNTGVLTADESNIGKYSVVYDEGDNGKVTLYYVTGVSVSLVWNGSTDNNTIGVDSENWLKDDTASAYSGNANLIFDCGDAIKTVILNGTDVYARSITVNGEYTFNVTADTTMTAGSASLGEGASTIKTGNANLTVTSSVLQGLQTDIQEGTVTVSDTLANGSTLDLSRSGLAEGTTLIITAASNGDNGATIKLNKEEGKTAGTLHVNSGLLHISGDEVAFGKATIELDNNSGLVAINGETSANIANNIKITDGATATLRAWGMTHDNVISGNITGGENTKLIKSDGGSFSLSGEITAKELSVEGGTLNLTGTATFSDKISGMGGSTLNLNSGANVTANQLRLNDGYHSACTVNVNAGSSLTITGTNDGHETDASILLGHWAGNDSALIINGGTMNASGAEVHLAWTGAGTFTINSGTASVQGINFWGQSNGLFGGTVNLGSAESGNGTLIVGGSGFAELASGSTVNLGKGTIQASADFFIKYNTYFSESVINLIGKDDGTIFDTNGHTITVNNSMSGNGNITVKGSGSLDLNGDVTLGKLTVEEGATLSSATGKTLSIASTIVNNGILNLNGTLTITDASGLEGGDSVSYVDSELDDDVNGYLSGSFIVISSGANSQVNGLNSVLLNGNETTVTIDSSTGNWVVQLSDESGLYYVNSGTIVYGSSDNMVANDATKGVVLNGGTLTMKKTLNENAVNGINVTGDSTISLRGGVTLQKSSVSVLDNGSLTLKGSGVYEINGAVGNSDELGTNVYLATGASGWTGTVKLTSGTTLTNTNIDNLANGANSAVEFNGVAGYLSMGAQTYAADIILTDTDDGTFAFSSNNGGNGDVRTFTGEVSGTGIFARTGAGTHQTFVFSGDVSNWTGDFKATNTNSNPLRYQNTTVTFSGKAKDIKTSVENTGNGTLTLNLDNDNDVTFSGSVTNDGTEANSCTGTLSIVTSGNGEKTFSGGINATSMTINGGSVVLQGTNNLDTVTVAANGSLILSSSDNTLTSVTIMSNATLNASASSGMGGSLTMQDNSTWVLSSANGVALGGDNATLTLGKGITLNIADDTSTSVVALAMADTESVGDTYSYTLATGIDILEGIDWTETEGDTYKATAKNYIATLSLNSGTPLSLENAKLEYNSVSKTLKLTSETIPEPTIPALTLPALSALALRRRRKQ